MSIFCTTAIGDDLQSIIYHYKNDILLADSDINILEKMFDEVNKQTNKQTNTLPCWGLQRTPEKIQRVDSMN